MRRESGRMEKNTPALETERLILRKFEPADVRAIYEIYSDKDVNRFLPWFPVKTMAQAQAFYENHFLSKYTQEMAYNYAVCLKKDNIPVGYVNVSTEDSFDLGYGLRTELWGQGITTEAVLAVIGQLKGDGSPYVTATHDVNNPGSGKVMKKAGMKYEYSYEEQWQPKNIRVTFRMYQLNLDGQKDRVYRKYWENSAVHFVEADI